MGRLRLSRLRLHATVIGTVLHCSTELGRALRAIANGRRGGAGGARFSWLHLLRAIVDYSSWSRLSGPSYGCPKDRVINDCLSLKALLVHVIQSQTSATHTGGGTLKLHGKWSRACMHACVRYVPRKKGSSTYIPDTKYIPRRGGPGSRVHGRHVSSAGSRHLLSGHRLSQGDCTEGQTRGALPMYSLIYIQPQNI